MLQQMLDNVLAIIYRALTLSLDLVGPVSVVLYVLLMGVIYLVYIKRSRRLASFVLFMGGVFFFFIIWNHPDYRWYKMRPWNGGYLYALVMIMTYVYLPMKLAQFATELWRNLRLRSGSENGQDEGPGDPGTPPGDGPS